MIILCVGEQIMATNMDLMKKIIEEKRQKTKEQDKLKRPDKQIGEARKRIKQHKGGGLFDK